MTGTSQRMAANNRLQSASAAKQRSTNIERASGMPLPRPFRPPLPGPRSRLAERNAAAGQAVALLPANRKDQAAQHGKLSFHNYPSANNGLFAECIAHSRKLRFFYKSNTRRVFCG